MSFTSFFDNGIPIHQIYSLCGCNEHKRVQRYAMTHKDYAELNPVVSSEQGGTRPVLIISNNTGNRYSPTIVVAAITGKNPYKGKITNTY